MCFSFLFFYFTAPVYKPNWTGSDKFPVLKKKNLNLLLDFNWTLIWVQNIKIIIHRIFLLEFIIQFQIVFFGKLEFIIRIGIQNWNRASLIIIHPLYSKKKYILGFMDFLRTGVRVVVLYNIDQNIFLPTKHFWARLKLVY